MNKEEDKTSMRGVIANHPKCLCFLPAAIALVVVVGCNLGMIANVQFPVLAPLNEEDHCHGVAWQRRRQKWG